MDEMLTGNDLALAESGAQLAVAWWKGQPHSQFKKQQIASYMALIAKLSRINQFAYPYESSDDMSSEVGSETIMVIDRASTDATRSAAGCVVG